MSEESIASRNLFTGKTERFLLERLEKSGKLSLQEIYNVYNSQDNARGFINKILSLNIASLSEPNTLVKKEVKQNEN